MAAAGESAPTPTDSGATTTTATPLVHIKCRAHDRPVHTLLDKQLPWRSVASRLYTTAIHSCIQPGTAAAAAEQGHEEEEQPSRGEATPIARTMSSYRVNHRRVASLPPTPELSRDNRHQMHNRGDSEDDDSESSIDIMMNDMSNGAMDGSSVFSEQYTATPINNGRTAKDIFVIDVGELLHSPSTNRRSVSVFQFDDLEESQSQQRYKDRSNSEHHCDSIEEVEMSSLLGKMHNVSSSSTESLREDQRALVLNELLQTERRYVSSLELVLTVFLSSVEKIIAPRDLRLLFPCQIEPLIILHRDLLSRLSERIEEGASRWQGVIGDVFGRICSNQEGEFVALYSAYMNEFKIALQTLVHYENTSPLFCKTISDCSQRTECEGLSLAAFLLTPIQRLPRYELLLKSLLKHTSQDHPDFYFIESALNALHSNLVLLDHSIQTCQLACTLRALKDDNRGKRGNKKNNKRKTRRHSSLRFTEKIRRHFSQTNIADFTSPSHSPRLPERAYPGRGNFEKNSHLARSVANLLEEKDDLEEKRAANTKYLNRAISFSDVLLLGSDDKVLEEQPTSPNKTSLARSPSITSRDDSIEEEERGEEEEEEEVVPRNMILNTQRASVYSSNSSTSGFDSLAGDYSYGPDDTGTLKQVYSSTTNPLNASGNTSTLRPLNSHNSTDSGYRDDHKPPPPLPPVTVSAPSSEKTKPKLKKKTSFTSAFKVLRRASKDVTGSSPIMNHKRSQSMGHLNKISIGEPTDFRHIEHKIANKRTSIVL